MRRVVISLVILAIVLAGGFFALRTYAIATAEKKFMLVHKNGTATPAQFGVKGTFNVQVVNRKFLASHPSANSMKIMIQPGTSSPIARE